MDFFKKKKNTHIHFYNYSTAIRCKPLTLSYCPYLLLGPNSCWSNRWAGPGRSGSRSRVTCSLGRHVSLASLSLKFGLSWTSSEACGQDVLRTAPPVRVCLRFPEIRLGSQPPAPSERIAARWLSQLKSRYPKTVFCGVIYFCF